MRIPVFSTCAAALAVGSFLHCAAPARAEVILVGLEAYDGPSFSPTTSLIFNQTEHRISADGGSTSCCHSLSHVWTPGSHRTDELLEMQSTFTFQSGATIGAFIQVLAPPGGPVAGQTTFVKGVVREASTGAMDARVHVPLYFRLEGSGDVHYRAAWNVQVFNAANVGDASASYSFSHFGDVFASFSGPLPQEGPVTSGSASGSASVGRQDFDASMILFNVDSDGGLGEMAFFFAITFDDEPLPSPFTFDPPGSSADAAIAGRESPDGFLFDLLAAAGELIFIDPLVAVGYDYFVESGSPIDSVLLPTGFGDDFYDLFLPDLSGACVDTGVDIEGGTLFTFDTPVSEFCIRGIEVADALGVDDHGFVTGLTFAESGFADVRQVPIPFDTDAAPTEAPEPAALALFALGLAGLGAARRRRAA